MIPLISLQFSRKGDHYPKGAGSEVCCKGNLRSPQGLLWWVQTLVHKHKSGRNLSLSVFLKATELLVQAPIQPGVLIFVADPWNQPPDFLVGFPGVQFWRTVSGMGVGQGRCSLVAMEMQGTSAWAFLQFCHALERLTRLPQQAAHPPPFSGVLLPL